MIWQIASTEIMVYTSDGGQKLTKKRANY